MVYTQRLERCAERRKSSNLLSRTFAGVLELVYRLLSKSSAERHVSSTLTICIVLPPSVNWRDQEPFKLTKSGFESQGGHYDIIPLCQTC